MNKEHSKHIKNATKDVIRTMNRHGISNREIINDLVSKGYDRGKISKYFIEFESAEKRRFDYLLGKAIRMGKQKGIHMDVFKDVIHMSSPDELNHYINNVLMPRV